MLSRPSGLHASSRCSTTSRRCLREGVHQMRVGLRRLRAAMSLFADILQDPQTAALKEELKWLTGELGPARELEVLVTRVVAPVKRRHSRLQGISSLSRDLTQQRAAAR